MNIDDYLTPDKRSLSNSLPFTIHYMSLKKGDLLTKLGDVEEHLYFLMSGKLEAGMSTGEDKRIIDFIFPGTVFTSLTSMLTQKPSDAYYECMTKCSVQAISYNEIVEKCKTSLVASNFFNAFLTYTYLIRVKKEKDALTKSVETRYVELVSQNPNIVKEISVGSIARYLNVHPNSLSRIRKRLASQNRNIT